MIQSRVYRAEEYHALVAISNVSSEATKINISDKLETEISNFETEAPLTNKHMERDLFQQLRTDHLNKEEKTNLLKVIADHQDVFF